MSTENKEMKKMGSKAKRVANEAGDIVRQAAWLAVISRTSKKAEELQVDLLKHLGAPEAFIEGKIGKTLIALVAPMLIVGFVWVMPTPEKLKKRVFAYAKRALVHRLASSVGDQFSAISIGFVGIASEVVAAFQGGDDDDEPKKKDEPKKSIGEGV